MPIRKLREYVGKDFDKYEYVLKNLLPYRDDIAKKYNKRHNEYLLNIMNNKIKCYEKYGQDPLKYYECFYKVEQMVETNFKKLSRDCEGINNVLDNCLKKCSLDSETNEEFLLCTEGQKGCFAEFKKLTQHLYNNMYKVILEKPKWLKIFKIKWFLWTFIILSPIFFIIFLGGLEWF